MRRFWKRGDRDLEQQLRDRRAEAPDSLVRYLAQRAEGDPRWFRPRARYALVAVLGVAVLVAAASAGFFSVASASATSAVNAVFSTSYGGGGGGDDDPWDDHHHGDHDDDDDDSPGGDQYHGRCGMPPRVRCHIDVDPDWDVQVKEGNSGTKVIKFKVTIAHGRKSDGSAKVGWATANGTALTTGSASIGNPDYVATSGSYTFPAGTDTMPGYISITIKGDTKRESNEYFYLNVTSLNASSTKIHDSSQHIKITIKNDD